MSAVQLQDRTDLACFRRASDCCFHQRSRSEFLAEYIGVYVVFCYGKFVDILVQPLLADEPFFCQSVHNSNGAVIPASDLAVLRQEHIVCNTVDPEFIRIRGTWSKLVVEALQEHFASGHTFRVILAGSVDIYRSVAVVAQHRQSCYGIRKRLEARICFYVGNVVALGFVHSQHQCRAAGDHYLSAQYLFFFSGPAVAEIFLKVHGFCLLTYILRKVYPIGHAK